MPSLDIQNMESGVNGGGFNGAESFEIPYGINEATGEQEELTAICSVTLTVDDWGSVSIDGEKQIRETGTI